LPPYMPFCAKFWNCKQREISYFCICRPPFVLDPTNWWEIWMHALQNEGNWSYITVYSRRGDRTMGIMIVLKNTSQCYNVLLVPILNASELFSSIWVENYTRKTLYFLSQFPFINKLQQNFTFLFQQCLL
jgi:hypothetical protein